MLPKRDLCVPEKKKKVDKALAVDFFKNNGPCNNASVVYSKHYVSIFLKYNIKKNASFILVARHK